MRDILDLHQALRDAGLDVAGLSDPGPNVRITCWNVPPTSADLAKAAEIIKAFDWTPPVIPDVVHDLSASDRQTLLDAMLTQWVTANPYILEKCRVNKH